MLAIPLIELLVLLVGLGMALLSRPQAGGLVNWLAKVLPNFPFIGGVVSLDQIVKLDRWITHAIGKATEAVTGRGTKWFAQLAHYQDTVGYWSLYWPVGLYHAVRHLVEHVIPRSITARTAPLTRRVDATEAQAKAAAGIAHSLPRVAKAHDQAKAVTVIERVAMPHAREWGWIHDHFDTLKKAVAAAAAGAIGATLPHAPSFPVPGRGLKKEVGKLWKFRNYVLGATGAGAIVATALGIIPRCVKSNGNIGKTARRICGLDSSLLDSLLLDGLAILSVVSVVEFANELRAIEDEALKIAGSLIAEWPS